jgi:hypothetical protein
MQAAEDRSTLQPPQQMLDLLLQRREIIFDRVPDPCAPQKLDQSGWSPRILVMESAQDRSGMHGSAIAEAISVGFDVGQRVG